MSEKTKKALKGFANLKAHKLTTNSSEEYKADEKLIALTGAQSCERQDNSSDYTIRADDDVYEAGSEFEKTELTITVVQMELDQLAALKGSGYEPTAQEMDEFTLDTAPEVALSFSGLRADGGYRLFRYYAARLIKYKHGLATRGQNNDPSAYELTFACIGRKCDNKLRTTKDMDKPAGGAADLTWLDTVPTYPAD